MYKVIATPAFHDNHIWTIVQPNSGQAAITDPGETGVVIDHLKKHQLIYSKLLS